MKFPNFKQTDSVTIRLILTIILNFIIAITEVIGGLISGSLSLLSDALHNFSDGISVIISYIAIKLKQRDRSYRHTFGLKRAEILAAVINSSILVIISFYLFYESIIRFYSPVSVQSEIMTLIAFVGFIGNTICMWILKKDSKKSNNIKSAYLHLLGDSFSSLGVIFGGITIYLWNVYWIDPLLTLLIGIYILKESYQILIDALHILMEGAPTDVSIEGIRDVVEKFPDVQNIHHIHLWMVGENDIHIEAHLNINDMLISRSDNLRKEIESVLSEKFKIRHITLQLECNQCPEEGLIKNHVNN